MSERINIFVFANLKPSQINYKIIPLSKSGTVGKVILLRKHYIDTGSDNVVCHSMPGIMRIRPFYWLLVPFFGIFLVIRYKVSVILNFNIFPHGFNAFFTSLCTGKPFIFCEINEDTIGYHKKPVVRCLIKAILSRAKSITVPGTRTLNYWKDKGFNKQVILHSTINTNKFIPGNHDSKDYDFIYIGEFDKNKRPEKIVEAFARIHREKPGIKLCMIGYGSEREKIDEVVVKNGLDHAVTIVRTNEVIGYLQRSRIFVMASQSEGLPCALLEAMACEVIPVVPDVGNIADVVTTGYNGALYDGSPEELEKWMRKMLTDYDSLETMRQNARNTIISGHSYEVATAKWDELLCKFN